MSVTGDIQRLIDKIRIVRDEAELQLVFEELKPSAATRPLRVAFVNAHALNLCYTNPSFLNDLLECDYVFRDGAGMKILYKMLGREPGLNLNGTDLIPRILGLYKGHDVALFGTDTPYLEAAAEKITAMGLNPVTTLNGFHEGVRYVESLRGRPAPLIVLAMGMPKQEQVAGLIARDSAAPTLILCGGAILDFIGGKVQRAPEVYQKYGMEWAYRLKQEPRRLFRRYVIGNFVFLYHACGLAMKAHQCREEGFYPSETGKPKILHVVRQFDPAIGGLESYVKSMAIHQQAQGYDCQILTLNKVFHGDGAELPSRAVIDGINVRRAGFWGRRRFFIPKISPVYFTKFDLVHVHNTDVFYDYVALVGLFTKTPCVATTHGGFFHTKDFSLIKDVYFNVITRISSLCYKAIFAISQNDYDTFKNLNKNVILQPNAIEPLGDRISDGKDFLYIGRLAKHKQITRVIEVFALLKKRHGVQGNLHIVGPEWDVTHKELADAAARHDIAEWVIFHGSATREDMRNVAASCGYFMSASEFEGFGMSMLEAMTVGMIPFVHNNESFTELVAQSGVGVCTDFSDAGRTADLVADALNTAGYEEREKALQFARRFSWTELVSNTTAIYKRFIK